MALLGILEKILDRRKGTIIASMDPATPQDSFGLDVTTARGIDESASIASWPIEGGAADHVFLSPPICTLEGVVTDTPVEFLAGIHTVRALPGIQAAGSTDAMRKLRELRDRKELVYVTCRRWSIFDMIIRDVSQREGLETGDAYDVSITLERVRIINSKLIPAQFDLDARLAGGGGTVDLGQQSSLDPRDYTGPTAITGVPF